MRGLLVRCLCARGYLRPFLAEPGAGGAIADGENVFVARGLQRRQRRQDAIGGLDQDQSHVLFAADAIKTIGHQRARRVVQPRRELHAGGACTDDRDLELLRTSRPRLRVCADVRVDQPPVESRGVLRRVKGDCMLFRTGRTEIVGLAADRDDQRVIGELALRRHLVSVLDEWRDRDGTMLPVETDHLADPIPKEMPVRLREIVGFVNPESHAARGDFMQMRFPEMRSRLFDQRDVRPIALAELVTHPRGKLEPTGATADDDNAVQRPRARQGASRIHRRLPRSAFRSRVLSSQWSLEVRHYAALAAMWASVASRTFS